MTGLFAALLARLKHPVDTNPETERALERAIKWIGPQLYSASSLYTRLETPLRIALDHCESLVDALPPETELTPAAVASDPLVHALFPSTDMLTEVIGSSRHVRNFVKAPADTATGRVPEELRALLAVRLRRKNVFGVALSGNMLQHDVAQSLLNFSGHLIAQLATSEVQARVRMRDAAIDSLLASFAGHVHSLRDELGSLQVERGMEHTHVALLRQQQHDDRLPPHARRIEELNQRLAQDIAELQPDHLVDTLADHLSHPERALRLNPVHLRTLRNGVILPEHAPHDEDETVLDLTELASRDRRRHVVLPVRFPLEFAREAVARTDHLNSRYMLL